jgi:hypothetical protein
MMSVHWVKADIAVASVDLISIRPLKPRVGGGQISAGYRLWTGGPGSYAKFSVFSKQKTHFCGRKLKDKLWAQRLWS